MKQRLLKTIALGLMAMVGVNAWAEDFTPTADVFFRTSNDNTGWNSTTYPQTAESCGDGQFAGNHNAGMFVLQKYIIPNISAVKTLTLTLTGTTSNTPDALAIWIYSTNDWSSDKTTENASTIASAYQSIVGVALHSSGTANTTYLVDGTNTKSGTNPIRHCVYSISGDKLTALKNAAAADGTFTLLITHTTGQISSGSTTDRKFYCSAHTTEAYRPKITVTYDKVGVRYGDNTKIAYSSFEAARSAVVSSGQDANITVMENQNITNRVNAISGKTINIVPGTSGVTLTNTMSNSLSFLANASNAGTINIGRSDYNMTITNSSTTTNSVIEVSGNNSASIVNIENITFSGISSSNTSGLIKTNDSSGKITLKDVTFSDCTASAENAGIVYCNANGMVTLSGDLTFTNCTGHNFRVKGRMEESSFNANQTYTIYNEGIVLGASAVIKMNAANRSKYTMVNENRCLVGKGNTGTNNEELVVSEAYTLSVNEANAATLIIPFATTIPDGATCYTLDYSSGTNIDASLVETTLPANRPVLVIATGSSDGTKYKFNASTRATSSTEASTSVDEATRTFGKLIGNYNESFYAPINSYILTNHSGSVAFRKVTKANQNQVKPYRAYMDVTYSAGAPEFLGINFDGNVTAIDAVEKKAIVEDGEIYNLQGVRMTGPVL